MKTKLLFLVVTTLSCSIFSCKSDAQDVSQNTTEVNVKNEQSGNQEEAFIRELKLDSRNTLELIELYSEGVTEIKTKYLGKLSNGVSCGNGEFIRDKNGSITIDTLNLDQSNSSYLIKSSIRGSTYDANCHFIVYKDANWKVTLLPFDRVSFFDIDNDGLDDIIEYKMNDSTIYSFTSGILSIK